MRKADRGNLSAGILLRCALTLGLLASVPAAPAMAAESVPLVGRQGAAPVFSLLGFVQQGKVRRAILGLDGLVLVAGQDELLLETYRVVRMEDEAVVLRDGQGERRVAFPAKAGGGAVPPGESAAMAGRPPVGPPHPGGEGVGPSFSRRPGVMPNRGAFTAEQGAAQAPAVGPSGGATLTPQGTGTGSTAAPQSAEDENPFARAIRERAQQGGVGVLGSGSAAGNPFGVTAPATPQSGGSNPFADALRQQGAQTNTSTDNPFMRAIQQQRTGGQ